jgi:hypothetical protein
MADSSAQGYASHRRYVPLFHLFALPVLCLILPLYSIVHLVRHPSIQAVVVLLSALALAVLAFYARVFATGNQDRIILLEERLRYEKLLSGKAAEDAARLTGAQIIGLRFASDGELAELVSAAVAESLSQNDVKKRVRNWRADHRRV